MTISRKPSIRFFHSTPLRARTNKVLAALEEAEDATQHVGALSALIVTLTEVGLEYYFLRPIQQAKVGFVARQTASLGISGAVRIMSPIVRSILAGTNAAQLRVIVRHIRDLM